MSKARKRQPRDRSPLYRLIAAGQLVHHALLEPALLRGLEPGDDALLYLLATADNVTANELADGTGLAAEPVRQRIARLIDREFVVLRASGPQMLPRLKLTPKGARLEALLADHWDQLEDALLDELKPRQRKTLGTRLDRIIALLAD